MSPSSPRLRGQASAEAAGWLAAGERGTLGALRFALWLLRRLGRRGMRPILYGIALYFFLTGRETRRASRAYLERVAATPEGRAALGGKPGWRQELRHIFSFADNTLDRIALFAGCADDLEVEIHGREHLAAMREGGGGLLLGAHLGSFDLLRAAADEQEIPVNVLMFTGNARRIQGFLDGLDPENRLRVIGIDPQSVRASFEVKACLERGEFVAVLADRVGIDGRERSRAASFLGAPAAFPEGPFLMSMVLRAPACVLVALKTGKNRYEIFAEPLAERGIRVARSERSKRLDELIQAYAARLENHCLSYPYQWFNFFDFWAPKATAERGSGGE